MEQHIRLLDCTLRDGGHINNGVFGEDVIKNIILRLVEAKIDLIEVGFLWGTICDADTARYHTIADVKRVLPEDRGVSNFCLMADFIDLDHLEPCDGTIEYIRLSFKRSRLKWGLDAARTLMDKGYKCFINPVNCNVYTDKEYLTVLEQVNELNPYGFSIVDTFGTMRKHDLIHILSLVEHNLNPTITVGLHLHENLGLAYSLAQTYVEMASLMRNIVIDCSLLGMGRTPGNLCTELIMDHLNLNYGKAYCVEPVLDAIDDYVAPIKQQIGWGYAIPYALSAKYRVHRTYAEFLMQKRRLKTKDIQRILSQIAEDKTELYDEAYIEQLYQNYMNVTIDSQPALRALHALCSSRKVVIIAPGASISESRDAINSFIQRVNPIVFSVNFLPANFPIDIVFCSNAKRIDNIVSAHKKEKIIVTSNLLQGFSRCDYAVSYNDVAYEGGTYCDNSTVMLINLLKKSGVNNVAIAGFDGFINGKLDFYDPNFEKYQHLINTNGVIQKILRTNFKEMELSFLTPSIFEESANN